MEYFRLFLNVIEDYLMFLLLLFIETGIDTLHELLNTIKDDAYHFRLAFKI